MESAVWIAGQRFKVDLWLCIEKYRNNRIQQHKCSAMPLKLMNEFSKEGNKL